LVAFRAPALADPDFPAFVLFDALLAGGKGLRLLADYDTRADTPLRREVVAFGHAREVESAFQASLYPYVYTLRATTPEAAQLPAAEAALLRSLEAAVERAWTDHELERARAEVAAGLARDLDTLAGRAHQLAFFEVAGGLQHLLGFEERLLAVDREAVRRVARRFKRETATLGWFVPTPGASVFTGGQARPPASTALSPGKAAAVDVASRAAPEVQTFPLTSGLTLRVTEAPRTPLVALRGRVEAGGLFTSSPSLSALLTSLFARAVQAGPGPPLAFDFDEAPAGSGHDVFLGFGATGLPEDLPALAESVARGFSGERADFEASRQHALARAQSAEGDTPSILVARTRALLFPTGSALSLPPWGDARTLGETTAPSVCDAFRRFVTPARTTVSVAGPVDPAQVRRAFEDAFRRVAPSPGGTGLERSEAAAPRGPAHTARIHLKRPDASQNDIHVAWPGDLSRPHDDAATSLLLYLLGETFYSGRLGRALVEPGLVYSVWTELRSAPGLHGFLLVQTAASTATTPEVVRRILEVLEAAARGEFTAAELEEAQAYLRGKAARGRDGARLLAQAALEPDPSGPAAQTVTLAQLNDTARRLFARGAPLVLIGGPE
jgi:predicted Zn-dependent peptidase